MREKTSGMIGDKEVEMHRVAKFVWAIDIVKHTSEDTKELVDGWVVGDEQKALRMYDEKVKELAQFNYAHRFEYPEDEWHSVNLNGLTYDCNFWTEEDGQRYITLYECFMDKFTDGGAEEVVVKHYMNTNCTDNFVSFRLVPIDTDMGSEVRG